MSTLPLSLLPERAVPLYLFALYMVTSVRICRYSAWRKAGAPNPFLPRSLRPIVDRHQRDLRHTC
ncbi:MAG: hypothetical protein OEY74_10605 [Gammaproteobacteria bacterium]|nr:hypothetical protein [Gammaproteobacteria bacterium]